MAISYAEEILIIHVALEKRTLPFPFLFRLFSQVCLFIGINKERKLYCQKFFLFGEKKKDSKLVIPEKGRVIKLKLTTVGKKGGEGVMVSV